MSATESGRAIVTIDGQRVETIAGLPLGAVLHRHDAELRRSPRSGSPRGLFCGMGVCFDCLVTVDGRAGVRACVTLARDGMTVERG